MEETVEGLKRQLAAEKEARRRVETLYRKSQEFILKIRHTIPSIIYIFDLKKGENTYINSRVHSILGYTEAEIKAMGNNIYEFLIHPDDIKVDIVHESRMEGVPDGEVREFETRMRHKDGRWLWMHSCETVFSRYEDGRVKETIGSSIDITEKKEATQKLEYKNILIRQVIDTSPNLIYLKDQDGKYILVNRAYAEMLDTTPTALMRSQKNGGTFYRPPETSQFLAAELYVAQTGQEYQGQISITKASGEKGWFLVLLRPFLNNSGVSQILTICVDITENKKDQKKLQKSEKKFRRLIDHSQAIIFTHDLQGVILSANTIMQNLLGFTEKEMIGTPFNNYMPAKFQGEFTEYLATLQQEKRAEGIGAIRNKAGKTNYLLFHNILVEEPDTKPYIIGFAQDISKRLVAENQLKRAKDLAERSAKAKELFLANMSHEIRTPMNGILGMAALLRKTNLDGDQQNYVQLIDESAKNLLVIINDVLDIAKIESGKLTFEEIPFNIKDTLQAAQQSLIYKAEEKDILLTVQAQALGNITVLGDPYRLTQILLNLLSNAIKFTHYGKVELKARVLSEAEDNYTFEISISDTGVGIAPEKLEVIFEGYTQANANTTREYGGTGLGLAISRNLVNMQGGRLWAESNLNQGSTFSFIISYKKALANTPGHDFSKAIDYTSLGAVKVLLAEDNVINQFLAKSLMQNWGFTVDVAYNGKEALTLHERNRYDLILMDIQMPEMSGLEATKVIRKSPNQLKAHIPIIALTANALKGDSDIYLAAGMNDYLSKPYEEEKLFLKIAAVLNRKYNSETGKKGESLNQIPAPKTTETGKLYNLSHIELLSRGDALFVRKMLTMFLDNLPRQLQEMEQSLLDQNWPAVGTIAHTLKPSIDTLQVYTIQEEIRMLEELRTADAASNIRQVAYQVIDKMEEVIDFLKQELANQLELT